MTQLLEQMDPLSPSTRATIDWTSLQDELKVKDLLASLLDASPLALLGIWRGKIVFANCHAEHLTGWTPAELVGEPLEKVFPFDWQPTDNDRGYKRVDTVEITRRDGEVINCLVYIRLSSLILGNLLIVSLKNLAELHSQVKAYTESSQELPTKLEDQLHDLLHVKASLEHHLKSIVTTAEEKEYLFDAIKDHVILMDRQMRIRWANKAFRMHVNKTKQEIEGRICYEVIYDRLDLCPNCPTMKSLIEGRKILRDHTDQNGRTWVYRIQPVRNSEGVIIGVVKTASDITTYRQYQEALEQSEERYRSIVDNLDDGYFENDREGTFTFINAAGAHILGCPSDEIVGSDFRNFTPPEGAQRLREAYRQLWQTGKPLMIFDHPITLPDGEIRYVDISSSLRHDKRGRPTGFQGTIKDVTARRKREEETTQLHHQLYQAQKLEAIGTLAGGIAHDFNNILMGIQGFTSLMLIELDPQHPFYEHLKAIESQVDSASDLTRQLLGFARGGKFETKKTNLNELLSHTVKMFGRTKKEIRIQGHYHPALWYVQVDRGQLEQVILNLLLNAWQAMPTGGTITLTTENFFIEGPIEKYLQLPAGRYVKFSVRDTGIGMDETTRERVFDPFFTTKELGRGTGLGLATAYGIVKGHGGVIKVYSESGQGTIFSVYLPAVSGDSPADEGPLSPSVVKGKGTILVVDDEQIVRNVTGDLLEWLGYTVLTASNAEEALTIYREKGSTIDLVLLDMIMPGLSGRATLELLKAMNPEIKVLFVSGYGIESADEGSLPMGVKGFLRKPFKIDELSEMIQKVLGEA